MPEHSRGFRFLAYSSRIVSILCTSTFFFIDSVLPLSFYFTLCLFLQSSKKQEKKTTADVIIVTLLNMLTVQPASTIINLLFKERTTWKPESAKKIEKAKTIAGIIFSIGYLLTLVGLTLNINLNLPISESNSIILTCLYSFLNEFTISQLFKGIYQYSLISILRNNLLTKDSFLHKKVVSLINPALLKIFDH